MHAPIKVIKLSIFLMTAILFLVPSSLEAGLPEPLFLSDSSYDHVQIKTVISADTFYLANDEKVHLIGLKAPSVPVPKKVEYDQFGFVIKEDFIIETIEDQSFLFVKNLLEERWVRLEFDAQKRGPGQVLLAYVYLADKPDVLINAEILRQGFSSLSLQSPNLKYQEALRAAYQEARKEQRGIHIE